MTAKKLEVMPSHKYVQDNTLISAQYSRGLSLLGEKLIRIAISNINSKTDTEFFLYTCNLNELAKELGIQESKHIYRDVKKASAELLDTKILVEDKKTGSYRRYTLFSYFDYTPGTGTISIKFNGDMAQFLLGLQKKFTQIQLSDVLFMKHSKYSIRIYEYIKMKLKNRLPAGKKTVQIDCSIDELRQATGIQEAYKQVGQLRQYVLQPAFQDIEEQANIHIEAEDIKNGRKIVGFRLTLYSRLAWEYKVKTS